MSTTKQPHALKQAETFINSFMSEINVESLKEEKWRDLIYLMTSKEFNDCDLQHRIKTMERYMDECKLLDALHAIKECKGKITSSIH